MHSTSQNRKINVAKLEKLKAMLPKDEAKAPEEVKAEQPAVETKPEIKEEKPREESLDQVTCRSARLNPKAVHCTA